MIKVVCSDGLFFFNSLGQIAERDLFPTPTSKAVTEHSVCCRIE